MCGLGGEKERIPGYTKRGWGAFGTFGKGRIIDCGALLLRVPVIVHRTKVPVSFPYVFFFFHQI